MRRLLTWRMQNDGRQTAWSWLSFLRELSVHLVSCRNSRRGSIRSREPMARARAGSPAIDSKTAEPGVPGTSVDDAERRPSLGWIDQACFGSCCTPIPCSGRWRSVRLSHSVTSWSGSPRCGANGSSLASSSIDFSNVCRAGSSIASEHSSCAVHMKVPAARIFSLVVNAWGQPGVTIRQIVSHDAAGEVVELKRNLRVLSAMSTLGPLLGLLGTVVGIIQSFDALGGRLGPARGEALAHGISLALVATAFGLAIAIVAVAFYYFFLNRVDLLVRELDDRTRQVIELVSSESHRLPPADRRHSPIGAADLTVRSRARSEDRECRRRSRLACPLYRPPSQVREDRPMLASRMQTDEPPVINMTPMVDVILCLLVFFMAATRLYDWDESEFVVNVPEVTEAAPATAAPDDLVLTVIKSGIVSVGESTYNLDQLSALLKRGAGAIRQPGGRDPRRRDV